MNRKKNITEKAGQGLFTIVLFIFIFIMMHNVNQIQGTARVVNYAGLVRGETQRVVKLEISGVNRSEEIKILDSYLEGIAHGSKKLKLVRIDDAAFQNKVRELENAWVE